MSATDALTITSAPDALTRYYDAKEREENAVLYINDAYLEALNSLEKLEAENAKLRELLTFYLGCLTKGHVNCDSCAFSNEDNCDHGRKVIESAKQVGIEVE